MGQNKGMVKFYKADKGFGFLDTDRGSVFFHISEVNEGVPEPGMIVSCDIISTPKGLQAKNIQLIEPRTGGGKFIRIGDMRIKVSNIKNYHIINEPSMIEKVKSRIEQAERDVSNPDEVYKLYRDTGGTPPSIFELQEELQDARQALQQLYDLNENWIYKRVKTLYITTYQNEEYMFDDMHDGIDVEAIVEELDKRLT